MIDLYLFGLINQLTTGGTTLQQWEIHAPACWFLLFGPSLMSAPLTNVPLGRAPEGTRIVHTVVTWRRQVIAAPGPNRWCGPVVFIRPHDIINGLYINRDTPKLIIYDRNCHKNGWFGGTPISGKPHIVIYLWPWFAEWTIRPPSYRNRWPGLNNNSLAGSAYIYYK